MMEQRNKVCGVDIHKKFLIATILSRDGTKIQKRYATDIDDLLNFRDWILENNCDAWLSNRLASIGILCMRF